MAAVASEVPTGKSLSVVTFVLAGLAAALLLICVLAAVVPVHSPRVGDGVSHTCVPVSLEDETIANDCAAHVRGRLTVATVAGFGAGLLGVAAFLVEAGIRQNN